MQLMLCEWRCAFLSVQFIFEERKKKKKVACVYRVAMTTAFGLGTV